MLNDDVIGNVCSVEHSSGNECNQLISISVVIVNALGLLFFFVKILMCFVKYCLQLDKDQIIVLIQSEHTQVIFFFFKFYFFFVLFFFL